MMRGFGGENRAAHFGPGQAHRRADLVLLLGLQFAELLRTEQFGHLRGVITTLAAVPSSWRSRSAR